MSMLGNQIFIHQNTPLIGESVYTQHALRNANQYAMQQEQNNNQKPPISKVDRTHESGQHHTLTKQYQPSGDDRGTYA